MSKPRLLVPMSLQFSVRYLLRTGLLSEINGFAQPVILLGWKDEALARELGQQGCEVHSLRKGDWGVDYERARTTVNLRHEKLRNSPSTEIRKRRQNLDRPLGLRVRRELRHTLDRMVLATPGGSARVQRRETELFWTDTNARAIERQLRGLKIDAIR
jgi:hypothetical protein